MKVSVTPPLATYAPVPFAQPKPASDTVEVTDERLQLSQVVRLAKDVGCLLSDVKILATCAANIVALPPGLQQYLGASNWSTLVGGGLGLAVDLYGAKKVFDNPNSTTKDKVVDLVHIGVTDVLGTACGSIPLFASIHNPVGMSLFIGGQLLGVGVDVYKTIHDIKRHGRQGCYTAAPAT